MEKLPRLLRFAARIALLYVVIFSLLRLGFWLAFDNPNDPIPEGQLSKALYLGLKFDLRLALLLVLPLLLFGWIRWFDPFRSKLMQQVWQFYLGVAALVTLLFYITDFGYFAYLHTRVDASILRFFHNPTTSMSMVWQTYPVVWLTIGIAAIMLAHAKAVRNIMAKVAESPAASLNFKRKALTATAAFFIVFAGLYGKFSWYPLRWSDAFFTTHAFAASVSSNPVIYFYYSYENGGIDYDEEKVRKHYDRVADYLGVDQPDAEMLNFSREYVPEKANTRSPNVVMVIVESLAAYKTGLSGNPLKPTPNFDRLGREGLYFNNFFTPTTGTARSVFATVTGIPDIQLNDTASRNPTIADQNTIINAFEGYEKFYFLGGSANWANIRGLLSHNIHGLNVYEEGSYSAPRNDVWGISDLDLMREANQVLRLQEKPFFAIIQTSGNHRPYTIPEDSAGFELRSPSSEELKRSGFISVKEFNAFRFMDHCIGQLMQLAKQETYFDNTIFVFYGDHGLSGYTGDHTSKHENQLQLGEHRVPLIIYAPQLLGEPRLIDKIASEVDVLPTIAALAGRPYRNTTFGRDLFNPKFDGQRYAFTFDYNSPIPIIGLTDGEHYYLMRANGSEKSLHRLGTDTPRRNVSEENPEKAASMEQLTMGLYETAKYIINNNHQDNGEQPH